MRHDKHDGEEDRWTLIKKYWPHDYTWLWVVPGLMTGLVIGFIIGWLSEESISNTEIRDLIVNLQPELIGIIITVTILYRYEIRRDKRVEERRLREELPRLAVGRSQEDAVEAIRKLQEREWLRGEQGLLKGTESYRLKWREANLRYANLAGSMLDESDLSGAQLFGADLSNTSLLGTDLNDADMRHAILVNANLESAILKEALLQRANLSKARLKKSNLIDAALNEAILESAYMEDCDLTGAQLRLAKLSNATLIGATLSRTVLKKADLRNVNLDFADLRGADFSQADLSEASLKNAQIDETTLFAKNSILPDGYPWKPTEDWKRFTAMV